VSTPHALLDSSPWNREHWKLFTIVSLTFFLDGVLFTIVPSILYLIVEPGLATTIFSINLLAFMLGAQVLGRLADIYGRRVMLIVAISIYTAATLLLVPLHGGFTELLILSSAINFGIGGEIGAAYSAMAELTPARHRGKAIMLSANMWNVGAAVIAWLALYYGGLYTDITSQISSVILTAAMLAIVIALARIHLPESPRWLIQRRRYDKAIEIMSRISGKPREAIAAAIEKLEIPSEGVGLRDAMRRYSFRLVVLILITGSQYVTYNIISYYLPYASGFAYGIDIAPLNIAIANLGASVGAFLLLPIIDRSRKISTLTSYLGGTITAITLAIIHSAAPLEVFLAVVFINMIFSEWAWASLSALESELFPTGVRASTIGFITLVSTAAVAVMVYVEKYISAQLFLALASLIWAIGLSSSAAWYLRGVESARKTVEELAKS
jgi:MFS family permease